MWPPDSVGTRVKTAPALGVRDFNTDVVLCRRPNAWGNIVGHSDGHGLCYEVRHDDGVRAYYDPDELFDEAGLPLSNTVLVHAVMET